MSVTREGSVTSQNDAAPKRDTQGVSAREDQLPVKTTLHQNPQRTALQSGIDQLPVKTTLHQNTSISYAPKWPISYQSKRRCTKTGSKRWRARRRSVTSQNDAAPKRRCSRCSAAWDQLPVKTTLHQNHRSIGFLCHLISYQSKRRCTKT